MSNLVLNMLSEYLPNELIGLVEEYAKDRMRYDRVMEELNCIIIDCRVWCHFCSESSFLRTFLGDYRDIIKKLKFK